MLIFEGPDGGGKTSLINKVQAQTGFPIAPRVVSAGAEAMVDLKKWTVDNLERGFENVLYDRHRLISEPIYGPLLRPTKPEPGFDNFEWLSDKLTRFWALQPIVILCLPPQKVAFKNAAQEENNSRLFGRLRYPQLYAAYHNWGADHLQVYRYDYTQPKEDTYVMQYIDARLLMRAGNR